MMSLERPVLIVGAGPVGLCLATALVRMGVPVRVFEALPELSSELKGGAYHPPTLEMFAEWEVVERVLDGAVKVEKIQYWEREGRNLVAEFNYDIISDYTPFPYRVHLPQHLLTRILAGLVEESPLAELHMDHEVVDFVDHGDHVEAVCRTPDGQRKYKGCYLCGADGPHSIVRQLLGVPFEGVTYTDRFMVLNTNLDLAAIFPNCAPVSYIFDPTQWVIAVKLPGITRIAFRAREDEPDALLASEPEARARLAAFLGVEPEYRMIRQAVYSVHQRVAARFRVGRALLLGDAAHICNPAGGMGLNAGIHDAHHLSQSLRKVLSGGTEDLLEVYARKRRRYVLDKVQVRSGRNYRALSSETAKQCESRNQILRARVADPELALQHLLEVSMLDGRDRRPLVAETV